MTTMTPAATPKALLLAALDEIGREPFFHLDVAKQAQGVEGASLLGVLEFAFDCTDVPARSARLAPLFTTAIAAAEALDVDGVGKAVTNIQALSWADAQAWVAAHGDELA